MGIIDAIGLHNPISMRDYLTARKKIPEIYAANAKCGLTDAIPTIESADPMLLAYLWLAIEQKMNILILEDNPSGIINAMKIFVPGFQQVQEIRHKGGSFSTGINFINAVSKNGLSIKDQLSAAQKLVPDRLIIHGNASKHIRDVFELSGIGISFIASISGNLNSQSIVKSLLTGFRIRPFHINMLDIVLLAEDCKIKTLIEYDWLERNEMKINNEGFFAKNYTNLRLAGRKHLDQEQLRSSKLMNNYIKSNLVNFDTASMELQKRAKFIRDISNKIDSNKIDLYYGIR